MLDGIISLLAENSGVATLVTVNGSSTPNIYKSVAPRGYIL
jgi:hypothetical protein